MRKENHFESQEHHNKIEEQYNTGKNTMEIETHFNPGEVVLLSSGDKNKQENKKQENPIMETKADKFLKTIYAKRGQKYVQNFIDDINELKHANINLE
jgi:hypothetical protein